MKEDDGDDFRAKLEALIEAAGTNLRAVSLSIGRNPAYLQQYVRRGSPKKLPIEDRLRIAEEAGINPKELISTEMLEKLNIGDGGGIVMGMSPGSMMAPNLKGRRPAELPAQGELPRDVPVYGVAVGGSDATFRLEHQAVDYVRRAPGIMHSKQVFAFYVANESMEPAFRHGALIFCDAGRPARVGDDVVIELRPKIEGDPAGCLLKRLVRRGSDKVTVEQFNPAGRFDIPTSDVVRVIKVLTNDDLFGG